MQSKGHAYKSPKPVSIKGYKNSSSQYLSFKAC